MPESGREFSGLREQEARGLKQSGLEGGGGGELAESRGAAGGWGTEAMAPPCLVEKLTVQLPPTPRPAWSCGIGGTRWGLRASASPRRPPRGGCKDPTPSCGVLSPQSQSGPAPRSPVLCEGKSESLFPALWVLGRTPAPRGSNQLVLVGKGHPLGEAWAA